MHPANIAKILRSQEQRAAGSASPPRPSGVKSPVSPSMAWGSTDGSAAASVAHMQQQQQHHQMLMQQQQQQLQQQQQQLQQLQQQQQQQHPPPPALSTGRGAPGAIKPEAARILSGHPRNLSQLGQMPAAARGAAVPGAVYTADALRRVAVKVEQQMEAASLAKAALAKKSSRVSGSDSDSTEEEK
jgi:hypothetical protein